MLKHFHSKCHFPCSIDVTPRALLKLTIMIMILAYIQQNKKHYVVIYMKQNTADDTCNVNPFVLGSKH